MATQYFSVRGTTCTSCEVVIERELKKQGDIVNADVSHTKRTITLETKGERAYSHAELNQILEKHHYSVGKKKQTSKAREPIAWGRAGGVLVITIALYLLLDSLGLLRLSPSSAQPGSFFGIFGIGFLASLSSCTAVVGGLVVAVGGAVAKEQESLSARQRFAPHFLFNLGRIGGFFLLGAFIGSIGSALQFSPTMNGIFVVAVALLMVVIGINLLELFPVPVLGMPKWVAHRVHDLAESKDPFAPIILGAMTFFLPCGFTQSMQLLALSIQNPVQSGLVMAVFALGTTPVLLGIGGATAYASGAWLKKLTRVAGMIVLILGMSNVFNGLALLGITKETVFGTSVVIEDGPMSREVVEGRQQITMKMTRYGVYEPDVLSVQAGVPVDWVIYGDDFMGCGDSLILRAFSVNTRLRPGKNLVQFTPTKPGRYTFSCSMGMIRGTMIVTEN